MERRSRDVLARTDVSDIARYNTKTPEHFRNIELFKEDMGKDLQTLLRKTTNLPEEPCQHFTRALTYLYNFSSHFHHFVDNGKVNRITNVNKEDANFFYMFMLSITQLLIKKIECLGRNNINKATQQ